MKLNHFIKEADGSLVLVKPDMFHAAAMSYDVDSALSNYRVEYTTGIPVGLYKGEISKPMNPFLTLIQKDEG
jgi:hypothetical protein